MLGFWRLTVAVRLRRLTQVGDVGIEHQGTLQGDRHRPVLRVDPVPVEVSGPPHGLVPVVRRSLDRGGSAETRRGQTRPGQQQMLGADRKGRDGLSCQGLCFVAGKERIECR